MDKMYSTSPGEKKDEWEWEPISPDEIAKLVAESPDLPNTSIDVEDFDEENNKGNNNIVVDGNNQVLVEKLVETFNSNDLKQQEINIIEELLPTMVIDSPVKRKRDNIYHDIDRSNNSNRSENSNDNSNDRLQADFHTVMKSVDPLHNRLEENLQKLHGAGDEHVKPHLENAHDTVGPHIEAVQLVARQWQLQTSHCLKQFADSTRNLMAEHVQPNLKTVKKGTVAGFQTLKQGTLQGLETSKRTLTDLPTNSKRTMEVRILPFCENTKQITIQTCQTISTKTIQSYHKYVQPKIDEVYRLHVTYSSCYMNRAPELFVVHETRWHMLMTEATLRAFGKVVFCDNPVSGGLICCAILLGSPVVAVCSISCVVSLTYTAHVLELVEFSQLRQGDFGVNAVLVGAGVGAFFQFHHHWFGWLGSLMMSTFFLSPITLLVYLYCTRSSLFRATTDAPSMPTLLIPYNFVMVVFLMSAVLWDRSLVVPAMEADNASAKIGISIMNGISKIFLVEGVWSGILILASSILCSRVIAGSLVLGSVVATLLGWTMGVPVVVLNAGTVGYNAALTTAALAYYFEPSWTLAVMGIFVIVLSGLFEAAFASFFWDIVGIPITLTLGYCFATVIVFLLDSEESCSRAGVLKRIPEDELCIPEEFLASRKKSRSSDDPVPVGAGKQNEEGEILRLPSTQEQKRQTTTTTETTPLIVKGWDV